MKEEIDKKQKAWSGLSMGFLLFLLIILAFSCSQKSSELEEANKNFEDYKYCVDDCVSDNGLCMSEHSSTIQGFTCVSDYNHCNDEYTQVNCFVQECLDKYNRCIQNYINTLKIETDDCYDDLDLCVTSCE